jgi:hypothetical protein
MGAWILDLAAENAVRTAAHQEDKAEPVHEEIRLLSEAMLERLPGIAEDACLGDVDWRAGHLRELIKWLSEQAGVEPDSLTVDGSTISSQEQLVEKLHTEVRYDLAMKETKAEKVQAQILAARRQPGRARGSCVHRPGRLQGWIR